MQPAQGRAVSPSITTPMNTPKARPAYGVTDGQRMHFLTFDRRQARIYRNTVNAVLPIDSVPLTITVYRAELTELAASRAQRRSV